MKPIRAFVAVRIPPPAALRPVLAELAAMGRPLKAVRPDDLHVTLKFLGDTDPRSIPDVARSVAEAAGAPAPFEIELAGLGVFPNPARPTVVWAGIRRAEPLVELACELETRLEPLGFAPERRAFVPHLTLARVKSRPPAELGALLERHRETVFGAAMIDAVLLLQSELRPEGPHYTALATSELTPSPGAG